MLEKTGVVEYEVKNFGPDEERKWYVASYKCYIPHPEGLLMMGRVQTLEFRSK